VAGAWAAAWLFANAVEVIGKGLLHRPALSVGMNGIRVHLAGFDSSFPSGHTARGLVLAFVVGAVWPRLSWAAAVWAVGTCVFLVVSAAHTPSDVLGGILVAVFAVAWVRFCGRIDAP
jgi:membrane-associated phospholipid phosphatase